MSDNSSTLKSYIDGATGAVQSAIGSVTGSTGDQAKGDVRQQKAQAEHDASHKVGKIGDVSVTPQGGIHKEDPNRSAGSYNQTIGSLKEGVGNLVGAEGLKADGIRQNRDGKEQEAQGQLSDLGRGISDRAQGTVGAAVAGITGDREAQEKFNNQRADGKAAQRSVEAELQKQA